jgi:omega-6 fatty acid desaturase (delta-12 desaturase)
VVHSQPNPKLWHKRLAQYRLPCARRSLSEIAGTACALILLWGAMYLSVSISYWLTLALAVPTAGFLVRLFMIQHDCGHGALFKHQWINNWTGRLLAIFTLTPYDSWRYSHNHHHAGASNLDRRGIGDITTLTVREYEKLGAGRRFLYRLYRHPIVMFGVGPTYLFVLKYRVPTWVEWRNRVAWISTMSTNVGIVCLFGALTALMGWKLVLAVHLPVTIVATTFGVWLFYVQHQFERTFWTQPPHWTPEKAALHGSSYLILPGYLNWLTANIAFHHIHHLSCRIPFYRLPTVIRDWPELGDVGHVTIAGSLRSLNLALWDEVSQRLVTFACARKNLT